MADTYLPADVRKSIIDVMRERKLTQRAATSDGRERQYNQPRPQRKD